MGTFTLCPAPLPKYGAPMIFTTPFLPAHEQKNELARVRTGMDDANIWRKVRVGGAGLNRPYI